MNSSSLPPGVTYRQWDHWVRRGYIKPRVRFQDGSGHPRDLPDDERRVLALMAPIVRDGVPPSRAAQMARQILTDGFATLGGYIVTGYIATPAKAPS